MTRFLEAGNRADLDEAVVYLRVASELTPSEFPQRSRSLHSLGSALLNRYTLGGDSTDFNEAVTIYDNVLSLTPRGHPDRSSSLRNLANACLIFLRGMPLTKFTKASDVWDRQGTIISLLREATLPETGGPPSSRLEASLFWVKIASEWSDPTTIDAYRISLGLLEIVIASDSTIESRHRRLIHERIKGTRTIAMDGAAFAVASGQVALALELLEQGRGMLLTQAGRYRTQVDHLEENNLTLAKKFRQISARMESLIMSDGPSGVTNILSSEAEDPVTTYQTLSQEWADVLDEIRSLDVFSTFLKSTPFTHLRKAADGGPVIVLNVSKLRTDAIIVLSNSDPRLLNLPDATPDVLATLSEQAHHNTSERSFARLLFEIWRIIVYPVVRVLREDIELPVGSRLWWCPTSTISHLPLHAAGDYTQIGQNLPDLFISSYTPTLLALFRLQEESPASSTLPKILAIAQSETPGYAKLPSVPLEIRNITASVDRGTILNESDATRESVLRAMSSHPWIHFACHGHVNQEQPFRSNFSLHNGPLALLDVIRQNLPRAELAFLSACHSAAGNRDQPDEVLHLTAGMQFAGFRSVVGTLWAVCDMDGPVVAESFYSSLLGTGGRAIAKSSAHALHRAVAELRMRPGISLSRWACFVHYGR